MADNTGILFKAKMEEFGLATVWCPFCLCYILIDLHRKKRRARDGLAEGTRGGISDLAVVVEANLHSTHLTVLSHIK